MFDKFFNSFNSFDVNWKAFVGEATLRFGRNAVSLINEPKYNQVHIKIITENNIELLVTFEEGNMGARIIMGLPRRIRGYFNEYKPKVSNFFSQYPEFDLDFVDDDRRAFVTGYYSGKQTNNQFSAAACLEICTYMLGLAKKLDL